MTTSIRLTRTCNVWVRELGGAGRGKRGGELVGEGREERKGMGRGGGEEGGDGKRRWGKHIAKLFIYF